MKIAIVGPGAMGCLFAYYLSRNKDDLVWLLDKDKARAEKIRQKGLLLEGLSQASGVRINITAEPKEIGQVELIVICVKSYDTKEAITHARPLIAEKTRVLTLQNGIGNIEILSEVAGADKVIGGVTNQGATLLEPGHIRHAGKGETIIGRLDAKVPVEMRYIREAFNKAGLSAKITRDIRAALWSKLIINCGINALTAITGLKNGRLTQIEAAHRILVSAVNEAARVAKRKRIKLLFDDPLAKVEAVCEATADNVSSMLQDCLNNRRTEIDSINGVIVRLGQELNIPVAVNAVLVDLVKTKELKAG